MHTYRVDVRAVVVVVVVTMVMGGVCGVPQYPTPAPPPKYGPPPPCPTVTATETTTEVQQVTVRIASCLFIGQYARTYHYMFRAACELSLYVHYWPCNEMSVFRSIIEP